jgi:hypothetical protein
MIRAERYGRFFLKVHVELFRLYYRLRPVRGADYRGTLEWLGNDAVNVVELQMPSEWFARREGPLYRVPRFLLVYELAEPSSGDLSGAPMQAGDDRAARMAGPKLRLRAQIGSPTGERCLSVARSGHRCCRACQHQGETGNGSRAEGVPRPSELRLVASTRPAELMTADARGRPRARHW